MESLTMRKFMWIIGLLLIGATSLVACGGDEEPTATPAPIATAAATAASVAQGDAEAGKKLYATTCVACHGPNGEGVTGLGKNMQTSEFIASKSDEELAAFVKQGRDISDPLNTTGVMMPPKGGNPALSDEQILDIIAFIRTIHQ
jgi:mono/diheme cytochrome c family protein